MSDCPQYDELLMPRRAVLISGEIDEHAYGHIQPLLLRYALESVEPVTVLIDSVGGEVRVGLRLYDLIRAMPGPTRGIVIGKCWSIALAILQSCTVRAATLHSTFLLHEIGCNVSDFKRSRKDVLGIMMRETLLHQQQIEKLIIARSAFSRKLLRSYMREGERNHTELSAADAMKLKLIDRIISHPFGTATQ